MTLREAAEKLAHEADNAWTLINTISNAASGTYPTDAGYGLANRLRAKAQALRAALAEEEAEKASPIPHMHVYKSLCFVCGAEAPTALAAPCPAGEVSYWGLKCANGDLELHDEEPRDEDMDSDEEKFPLYAAAPGKPEEGHSVVDATERTGPGQTTKGDQSGPA